MKEKKYLNDLHAAFNAVVKNENTNDIHEIINPLVLEVSVFMETLSSVGPSMKNLLIETFIKRLGDLFWERP